VPSTHKKRERRKKKKKKKKEEKQESERWGPVADIKKNGS